MTETQTKVVKTAGQIKGYYGLKTFEAASKNTLKGLAKDFLGKDEDARNLFLQLIDENFFAQTLAAGEDIEKALEAKFGTSNSQNNAQAQQAEQEKAVVETQQAQSSQTEQTQPVQQEIQQPVKENFTPQSAATTTNAEIAKPKSKKLDIILAIVFGLATSFGMTILSENQFSYSIPGSQYAPYFEYIYLFISPITYIAAIFFGISLGKSIKSNKSENCKPLAIVSAILFVAFIISTAFMDGAEDFGYEGLLSLCPIFSAMFAESFLKPKKIFLFLFGTLASISLILLPVIYFICDYAYSDFPPAIDILQCLFISFATVFVIGIAHKTELKKVISVILLCFFSIFGTVYSLAFNKLNTLCESYFDYYRSNNEFVRNHTERTMTTAETSVSSPALTCRSISNSGADFTLNNLTYDYRDFTSPYAYEKKYYALELCFWQCPERYNGQGELQGVLLGRESLPLYNDGIKDLSFHLNFNSHNRGNYYLYCTVNAMDKYGRWYILNYNSWSERFYFN